MPNDNVFEVSLLGTGGGYGESIVIHLGNQNWIVIDSCIDPKTKTNLPLDYLRIKGVNIEKNVKLIICTHWHDDHILGISELFESSKSSIFCMARATDTKKFLQFVGLDYHKSKGETSASSTTEIKKCFDLIKNRKSNIKGAEQDKLLLKIDENHINAKVFSLSPSDFVANEFGNEISTLITEYGCSSRKFVLQSPNDKSVALLISVNNHYVILGSDLEVSKNKNKGWLCILDNCQCISNKASLFKIPHHGSENGYHVRIWNELLTPDVTAKLTPWNIGNKLPKNEMLNLYLNHTENLYSTSLNNFSNSPKKRDRSISKAINKFNNSVREIKYKFGIVRCRINALDNSNDWQTDLYGEAIRINKYLI